MKNKVFIGFLVAILTIISLGAIGFIAFQNNDDFHNWVTSILSDDNLIDPPLIDDEVPPDDLGDDTGDDITIDPPLDESLLPDGYVAIDFIESNGTQAIDTNLIPVGSEYETRIVFEFNKNQTQRTLFGGRTDSPNTRRFGNAYMGSTNTIGGWVGTSSNLRPISNLELNTKHHLTFETDEVTKTFKRTFNEVTEESTFTGSIMIQDSVGLFGAKFNGNYTEMVSMKCYSFQIYEDGELALDFVPALDPNSIPCMYDTISQDTFYSVTSKEFLAPQLATS